MSTPGIFHFKQAEKGPILASVYVHHDCYLSGDSDYGGDTMLEDFFKEVNKDCEGDTRFDDPPYLAAKFVVFQAGKPLSLSFLGVGVVQSDDSEDYNYYIICDNDKKPWFYVEDSDKKRIFCSKPDDVVMKISYKKANGQTGEYALTQVNKIDAKYIEGVVKGKGFRKFIRANAKILA